MIFGKRVKRIWFEIRIFDFDDSDLSVCDITISFLDLSEEALNATPT